TGPTGIVFLAGASGLALVALLISYLPVLYAAFNRREIAVTTLEALAGSPPWGPELLARQALIGDVAYLPKVYERWTEWAADIAASHTNYRTLVFFRSPDPQTSWLLGLLAVLDAAALHLALNPGTAPAEARPLLRVGYITMRKLARNLGILVNDDPHPDDPIALTREEVGRGGGRGGRGGVVVGGAPGGGLAALPRRGGQLRGGGVRDGALPGPPPGRRVGPPARAPPAAAAAGAPAAPRARPAQGRGGGSRGPPAGPARPPPARRRRGSLPRHPGVPGGASPRATPAPAPR